MTVKMPMSGSPEKRRDCIAQLPLRSTSGGSKFASEHVGCENSARDPTLFVYRHYGVIGALCSFDCFEEFSPFYLQFAPELNGAISSCGSGVGSAGVCGASTLLVCR